MVYSLLFTNYVGERSHNRFSHKEIWLVLLTFIYRVYVVVVGTLHGFASWFKVYFDGPIATTILSTSPNHPYVCILSIY